MPIYMLNYLLARFLNLIIGCSVPFSCKIGVRVIFPHGFNGVYVSGLCNIYDDVTIMHQVTIGSNYGSKSKPVAPIICEKVFIGVGAKIIGNVTVGKNSKIGANALVVKSVRDNAICYGHAAIVRS